VTRTPYDPQLVEQSRLELSMAASAHERASRPRGLVVLAGLVLVAASIYALVGYRSRASAMALVDRERTQAAEIARLVEQLVGGSAAGASATQTFEPDPRAAGKLEKLASDIGLGKVVINAGEAALQENIPGHTLQQYTASVYNRPADKLLAWLYAAKTATDPAGVSISRISLRPATGTESIPGASPAEPGQTATGGWNLDVAFQRLERKP
jgi:type II secretory pathway component PulM